MIKAAGRDFTLGRGPVEIPPEAVAVFDGAARVGQRYCNVRSLIAPGLDLLVIEGAGTFALPHGEDRIEVDPAPGARDAFLEEALLGPALVLALARRGAWVLHASASVLGDGVVAFLGESGAGKSTLARLLADEGLPRAADDLLAITEGPAALPHFPQLKLEPAEMAAISALEPRYPLIGIYELTRGAEVASLELPMSKGTISLIRHTIGGKLFDTELMAVQFGFAAQLATRVPVRTLHVPWRMNVAAEVLAELRRHH